MSKVLVIKLSALGDFVQAVPPMQAIRAHHQSDEITLLTTPTYAALARSLGLFDHIWEDGRPRGFWAEMKLLWRIRRARFKRIYDLQTSERTSSYFQALRPGAPEWCGIALGASHRHTNPRRDLLHTLDRQAEQLSAAGIRVPTDESGVVPPDLSDVPERVGASTEKYALKRPFVLLVPGGAPHRPAKRWPPENYGVMAARFAATGMTPVIIGGPAEAPIVETIQGICAEVRSLVGQTSFFDILALGKEAALAIGNDTGPMHLIAAAGAPCLVLFSANSDPDLCAPRGANVHIMRVEDLRKLPTSDVTARIDRIPPRA